MQKNCIYALIKNIVYAYGRHIFGDLPRSFPMQALAKDLPWKMKESRVLEILQAVNLFI